MQRPHVDVVAGFKTKSLKGQFTVRHRPFVLFALEDDTRMRVWPRSHTKLAKYNGPPSKMPISTVREDDVVELFFFMATLCTQAPRTLDTTCVFLRFCVARVQSTARGQLGGATSNASHGRFMPRLHVQSLIQA